MPRGVTPPDLYGLCERCWQRSGACVCDEIPIVETKTELLVIRHAKETWRTSNTGRLASLALPQLSVVEVGRVPDPDLEDRSPEELPMNRDPEALAALRAEKARSDDAIAAFVGDGAGVWLLFPSAREEPLPPGPLPSRLVVPDGSWRQARRIIQRVPRLGRLPRMSLPPLPERLRLRRPPLEEGMSTLEAIARALAALEGEDRAEPLEALYALVVERHYRHRRRSGA
ncbi:DTW domain-containing protein [Myxococcota bacterium]|nr:DTW domain-containing protein [Myxococcota bacterium]